MVTAAGSSHSMLLVAYKSAPFKGVQGEGNDGKYPVMEINRFPIGVIPWIKRATVCIEFIREHEDHLAAIFIGWDIVHLDRGVLVDETKVPNVWYLSGCIGGDATPTAILGVVR